MQYTTHSYNLNLNMKKSLFLFVLMFSMVAQAVNVEKQYKKLIENYDIADEAKSVDPFDAKAFWNAAISNNEQLTRFAFDIKKNKGAEKETLEKVAQLPRFYPQYDESIVDSLQGFCDSLLMEMGIADSGIPCTLHVVWSDGVEPFTALTEDGFAMCLPTGLISRKGITEGILMGYVAHEFAHGALNHHARSYYAQARQSRKDDVIIGLLEVANEVIQEYNASTFGRPVTNLDLERQTVDVTIENKIMPPVPKYAFIYDKDLVFEADLVAYRFLEHLGKGEEFINGLKILGSAYESPYDGNSCRPTFETRIDLLKYAQQHPELGNKKNAALKKKNVLTQRKYARQERNQKKS